MIHEERNIEIRKLYSTGDYSRKELAERFKLCIASIGIICKGIKIDRSKINKVNGSWQVSAVNYEEAARLYREEKWTLNLFSIKYGVSRERVRQILAKQGITNNTVRRLCADCEKELEQNKGKRKKLCYECAYKRKLKSYKRKICEKCGKLTLKNSNGCGSCRTVRKEERWKKIQKLWNEDKLTLKEIAEVIGITKGAVYQNIHKMRNAGWQVDRRNKGYI